MLRSAAGAQAAPRRRRSAAPVVPPRLGDAEVERYSRQLVLPEWSEAAQLALRDGERARGRRRRARLAGRHLPRRRGRRAARDRRRRRRRALQPAPPDLHFTPDVGEPKAESAAAKLRFLNPDDRWSSPTRCASTPTTRRRWSRAHDLVVDCSDSFATRYEVNAACCAARRRRWSRAAWSASRAS